MDTNGAAETIDRIISQLRIVNWEDNVDVQNKMRNQIEDYLFELKDEHDLDLNFERIDEIMEQCLDIAKARYRS